MTIAEQSFNDKFGEPPIPAFAVEWVTHRMRYRQGWTDAIAAALQAVSGASDPEEIAAKLTELLK